MSKVNYGKEIAINKEIVDNDVDNLYYNVQITNNTPNAIAAEYIDSKAAPFLTDPQNYYLTIARFSLPNQQTAVRINWVNTNYYVTLSLNGVDYSSPVDYISYNNQGGKYIFSYQHFCDMINAAWLAAFNLIPNVGSPSVKVVNADPNYNITEPPYITFDSKSARFSIWCQQGYDSSINPITVEIWMNNILYYLFDNWLTYFRGENNADHKDYQLIVKDNFNNIPVSPEFYYQFEQEYAATYNLQDLKQIRFVSNLLPIRTEFVPSLNNAGVQGTQLNYSPIITDFEPNSETGSASVFRNILQYTPTGEYRLIDCVGSKPVDGIDVRIFWVDNVGNQYPLYLQPYQSVTIKYLFIKKSLYKNQYKLKS